MDKNTLYVITATAAEFTEINPVLKDDEWGKELDTNRIKIGDNETAWNDLGYFGE